MPVRANVDELGSDTDPVTRARDGALDDGIDVELAAAYLRTAGRQLMPIALAAAERAIQLDPHNGEAYTALGSLQTYEWNWDAEQNLTRGISLNSIDPIAEFKYLHIPRRRRPPAGSNRTHAARPAA